MSAKDCKPLPFQQVPIKPGLTLVMTDSDEQKLHVKFVIQRHAAKGSRKLGIPFPKLGRLVSLHACTSRAFEQIRLLGDLCTPNTGGRLNIEQRHIGRDGFDPCRDEGINTVLEILQSSPGIWLCIDQPLTAPLPDHVIEGLTRLKQAATANGSHIMVFSTEVPSSVRTHLGRIVDEIIEVQNCEPEPGARHSFHVKWHGALHLGGLDDGSVMCSVRIAEGRYAYKGEPFIATDLRSRVMWLLRCQGWSLEAIATLLKVNRSTVKRRLDQLPRSREVDLPDDWLDRYRDALDLPGGEAV
jgi:hypothetical protein